MIDIMPGAWDTVIGKNVSVTVLKDQEVWSDFGKFCNFFKLFCCLFVVQCYVGIHSKGNALKKDEVQKSWPGRWHGRQRKLIIFHPIQEPMRRKPRDNIGKKERGQKKETLVCIRNVTCKKLR